MSPLCVYGSIVHRAFSVKSLAATAPGSNKATWQQQSLTFPIEQQHHWVGKRMAYQFCGAVERDSQGRYHVELHLVAQCCTWLLRIGPLFLQRLRECRRMIRLDSAVPIHGPAQPDDDGRGHVRVFDVATLNVVNDLAEIREVAFVVDKAPVVGAYK